MRINKKIVLYLLSSFFLVTVLLSVASIALINHSQQVNINLFKQEFVELGTEYFGDNSTMFYNGLDGLLTNAIPTAQSAITAVSKLDPQNTNTFIINMSNQVVIYGTQNNSIISLVNKSQLSNFIQQYLVNQKTDFDNDNYSAFLADKSGNTIPGEVHLKVYGNYGLIIGYGQTFNTGTVRINYIKRQNQALFRDDLFLSLAAFVIMTLASVSLMIIMMRKIVIKPIQAITLGLRRVEQGSYDTRININTNDEMGKISAIFNQMAFSIKKLITDLSLSRSKIQDQYHDLSHEQVRLESSIESLNIGFIMTDSSNKIIMINNVAKTILAHKLSAEDVTIIDNSVKDGEWTTDIVQDKLVKNIDFKGSLNKVTLSTRPVYLNEMAYNGRVLSLFIAPILDRTVGERNVEKLGTVVLLEDITEAKILERSKDEFFSIASHELRTPLTAIRGNTSLIQSYYADILKDQNLAELISDIHESSVRLIAIVNDFLDASRLEQGKIQYKFGSFQIDEVIESVIYEMGGLSKSKGIAINLSDKETFKLQALPEVYADKNRIKQIVYNLVGNAMNYSEKGSVTISIKIIPGYLKVFVTDTGRGMAPEAQQLLFHKFQQAGSSLFTRNTSRGTGLGLYISRLMIEQMHGHIQLESSAPGKGSVFSFTVPLVSSQHIAETNSPHVPEKNVGPAEETAKLNPGPQTVL